MKTTSRYVLMISLAAVGCASEPTDDATITVTTPTGTYLRVASPDGTNLAVGQDGLVRAAVFVGHVEGLQTVGFGVGVSGGRIIEWSREDEFLTEGDGQILQLIAKNDGQSLELVVATTKAVSTDDPARIATLTIEPTTAGGEVSIDLSGDQRGLITSNGARLEVAALPASF